MEHRGVVLGMAQLEDKPALHPQAYITEVESDCDVNGELKDAQYDDQVMVYPKWHETCKYIAKAIKNNLFVDITLAVLIGRCGSLMASVLTF